MWCVYRLSVTCVYVCVCVCGEVKCSIILLSKNKGRWSEESMYSRVSLLSQMNEQSSENTVSRWKSQWVKTLISGIFQITDCSVPQLQAPNWPQLFLCFCTQPKGFFLSFLASHLPWIVPYAKFIHLLLVVLGMKAFHWLWPHGAMWRQGGVLYFYVSRASFL